MSLQVIQSAQGITTDLISTTVSAIFSNPVRVGNLVAVCCNGGIHQVTSIADTPGSSYVSADTGGFAWSDCEIWYSKRALGGSTTVTVTNSAAQAATVQVYEIQGADPDSPLSVHANANGDGVTSNTPTVTTGVTSSDGEILVATGGIFLGSGTNAFSVGAGFTNFLSTNSTPTTGVDVNSGAQTKLVTAAAQTATFGLAAPGTTWEITVASFKAITNFPGNIGKRLIVGNGTSRSEVAN